MDLRRDVRRRRVEWNAPLARVACARGTRADAGSRLRDRAQPAAVSERDACGGAGPFAGRASTRTAKSAGSTTRARERAGVAVPGRSLRHGDQQPRLLQRPGSGEGPCRGPARIAARRTAPDDGTRARSQAFRCVVAGSGSAGVDPCRGRLPSEPGHRARRGIGRLPNRGRRTARPRNDAPVLRGAPGTGVAAQAVFRRPTAAAKGTRRFRHVPDRPNAATRSGGGPAA